MQSEPPDSRARLARFVYPALVVGVFIGLGLTARAILPVADVQGFAGSDGFVDYSGDEAEARMGDGWPESVDPSRVRSVSFALESTRDSYGAWYRVELDERTARRWADDVHDSQVNHCNGRRTDGSVVEAVRRDDVPIRANSHSPPDWWRPASRSFRATEAVVWYADGDSGVSRATYSYFDESKRTLWIHEFAQQHLLLWDRGQLPDGTPIETHASPSQGQSVLPGNR